MKLNEEQTATVKQLVSNEVRFNETYFEVYDHITTALEAKDALPDIQKAYSDILEEDFGGHYGIEQLESFREREFKRSISSKRLNFFVLAIKWPRILITLPLAVLVYYCAKHQLFLIPILLIIVSAMILPMLLITVGNFITGLTNNNSVKRKSVGDDAINLMCSFIFKWFWRLSALSAILGGLATMSGFKVVLFPKALAPAICTATFLFCVLNAAAVLTIYYKQFKIRVTVK